jgi:histidinol dehydrogenase
MRLFDTRHVRLNELRDLFAERLAPASDAAESSVREILSDVRRRGDAALLDYTRRWDCASVTAVRVDDGAIRDAVARIRPTELWPAMELAASRIRSFHEKQVRRSWTDTSAPGEVLGQIVRPLKRVGVYAPGGTADYPSTVLMAALPAIVAGVDEVALATPPRRDTGLPPDATLAAAHLAGIREVYAVGGAQAVAAFAYGTESIARVDKVVGPGNLYVNMAKRLVYGVCGIDMLAGPSEVAVLADDAADAGAAAAEILAQCEHDRNCSALVVSTSRRFLDTVRLELDRQLETLPRAEIARQAIIDNGYLVLAQTLDEAAEIVSLYAPEHLHLLIREPWAHLGVIANAGAILIGEHTSAPLGDYIAGPSHTLPTAGCARFSSPLNVDDFVKKTSLLYFDAASAGRLSPAAAAFARFEGLQAHERAAVRASEAGR